MKKTLIFLFSLSIAAIAYADKSDLELFTRLTKETAKFLNSNQDKPVIKQFKLNAGVSKKSFGKTVAVKIFTPQKYDFTHKTPYGEFRVLVFETSESSFKVSFQAEAPIQKYELMDSVTKNSPVKENLNEKTTYTFTVNKPFKPSYVLILSQYKDDYLSQNIIPLYKKANVKTKE